MIGFVIGTICLIGLAKVVRHHRYGHCHGGGGRGCGRRGFGRGRGRWRGRGGGWGRFAGGGGPGVEYVVSALGLSEDQERQVRDELRAFRKRVEPMRAELSRSRRDLGSAMRGDSFDETVAGEMFARHDDLLRDARGELVGLLATVHAVLDDDQRRILASILEGEGHADHGGPFRSAAV